MKRKITPLIFAAICVVANTWNELIAGELEGRWNSEASLAQLPAYCRARASNMKGPRTPVGPAEVARWKAALGNGWIHTHHYCNGLHHMNLANREYDRAKQNLLLQGAVKQFDYMQRQAQQSFVLQPEISLMKAKALLRLGDPATAIQELKKALQLKKNYAPAYAAWSDYYKKQDDDTEARRILEEGLKYAPTSKGLRRRLAELGPREKPKEN
jgi:tetratricopeptide (TPR) repeat protein